MKRINLVLFKLVHYAETPANIYESIRWGSSAVVFFIISSVTKNHSVAVWTSIFAGFTFALFILKMKPVVDFFKRDKKRSVN